eukprot:TRINITY_DN2738_c0_g1_i2.p1 TRINITY_DN2738_c0_g1~~TRINITY_DN2738_c0_g1_i2.p1  ORF type:complete len:302 (-),score=57.03 TRINITY_DN2738_c0_g1_i2:68-973(-)
MLPRLARRLLSSQSFDKDLIIIGGGPGGYVAAIKAGQLGLNVACVEKRGALGGTCLNVGCIPSKALLNATHMYHDATHRFQNYGITFDNVKFDLGNMMKQKETAVSGLTKGIEGLFKKNKVEYVKGSGTLTGKHSVKVAQLDGTVRELTAKNIVLATGSEVMPLPGINIDEDRIVSSTGALALKKVPKRLAVIGGGIIGLELGSVWSRLGAEVTVIEFLDHIGGTIDVEIGKAFHRIIEKQGFKFRLSTKVLSATPDGDGVKLVTQPAAGGETSTLAADVVLVSVGRRPFTEGLGLAVFAP